MRKTIILLLLFGLSISVSAQQESRVAIQGKIKVDEGEQVSGINVFNVTSKQYTFTDSKGMFTIPVKKGDTLAFSSIRFQQFLVAITASVIKNKRLNIDLNTRLIQLDEVVVKPDLTGDLQIDAEKLSTNLNLPHFNSDKIMRGLYNYSSDLSEPPTNDALDLGYLQNGINFVSIFGSLYDLIFSHKGNQTSSETAPKKKQKEVKTYIRDIYNNQFFKSYLNIDENQISDYLYYMQAHGLTSEKMRSLNPLQLVQFLIKGSEEYRAAKNK